MTKNQQNVADITFIMAEIAKFRSMTPVDEMAHLRSHREDTSATLGRSGRTVLCGRAAIDRLAKIAERTLQLQSSVDRGFDLHGYLEALGESLIEEYLVRGRDVDERSASRMVDRAKRRAVQSFVQVTHYLPCEVFSEPDPDRFSFGPVLFIRTECFLAEHDPHIAAYSRDSKEAFADGLRKRSPERTADDVLTEAEAFATRHIEQITRYFLSYDWVASVTIDPSHFAVSQRRAERAVDAALDALRLFVLYTPERLRRAKSMREPTETHQLYTDGDGKLSAAAFYAGRGATAGTGWYEHHTQAAAHLWRPLEDAIRPLCADESMDELNQRLLDALDWFGQAVQETEPAPKVVKYAAALERLTMTGHVDAGIEKLVIKRVLLLNQERTDTTAHQIEAELAEFYECRSNLMHGSISTSDPGISGVLRTGWQITRWSIFEAAQLFELIRKHGTPNRKGLAAAYDGGRQNLRVDANGA